MKYSRLHRAVDLAAIMHNQQDRKYSGLPYIVHPLRVMTKVRSVSDDEDMLIAAVLHDVVEDTAATIDLVDQEFGSRVSSLVSWLTDVSVPDDGNRATRKAIDLEHTAHAPEDAQTIKLADMIDNATSIFGCDPDFANVYMAEKQALLKVLTKGNATLYAEASRIVDAYKSAHPGFC